MPNVITLEKLDNLRKHHFRPTIVACFVWNKKIFLGFTEGFNIWQFPQGRIDNKETVEAALIQKIRAEIGGRFARFVRSNSEPLMEDRIRFLPEKYDFDSLTTDDGTKVVMQGKHYLFYAVTIPQAPELTKTAEFDEVAWLTYLEAQAKVDAGSHQGKKRIMTRALSLLKQKGYIF